MNIDLNIHVLIILVAALAGAAASLIIVYAFELRRTRRARNTFRDSLTGLLEDSFEPENLERVNVPVPAEQLTVIPDRYCQKCNEPRGGRRCPLCGSKTITLPPEVLAEEIEAHRPKGSES